MHVPRSLLEGRCLWQLRGYRLDLRAALKSLGGLELAHLGFQIKDGSLVSEKDGVGIYGWWRWDVGIRKENWESGKYRPCCECSIPPLLPWDKWIQPELDPRRPGWGLCSLQFSVPGWVISLFILQLGFPIHFLNTNSRSHLIVRIFTLPWTQKEMLGYGVKVAEKMWLGET